MWQTPSKERILTYIVEVICIRHAEAISNICSPEEGIVGSDLELTRLGYEQAHRAAHSLAKLAIDGVINRVPDVIYSSPYTRTRQTADIIARELDRSVEIDFRLREIQKGDWHNMTVADVLPLEAVISREDRPHFTPPAGENWFDVAARMTDFIADVEARGEKTVVLVSHNHPIETMIGKLSGRDVYEWEDHPIRNASISRIVLEDGIWHIDERVYDLRDDDPSGTASPLG